MDATTLQTIANGVVIALAPALTKALSAATGPLVTTGEELIKSVGQAAGEHAAALLKAISRKFKGRPTAEEAMADLVKTPDDQDAQAALRLQLKKLLEADEAFAHELRQLLDAASKAAAGGETKVNVDGERSIGIGGDVNAPIFTGNVDRSDVHIDIDR